MLISITDPLQSTYIFITIFSLVILCSVRKSRDDKFFSPSVTQELKGLAILAVIFSHVGYFLVTDHRFLFPLSIMAGVGVNLFLFLSGYGLSVSALAKPRSIGKFYVDRLSKLYVPMWICLGLFLILDFCLLGVRYEWSLIARSALGYFDHADIYRDINSPLWYLSLMISYYLIFPLLWIRKAPWLSALTIYILTYYVLASEPEFLKNVQGLWQSHLLAFPVGMVLAAVVAKTRIIESVVARVKSWHWSCYGLLTLGLLSAIAYTAYYSGVGKGLVIEERMSLVTMALVVLLFLIKKIEFRLFSIFGLLSYELYLLHWPLMYRYDLLFKYLPAWLAMIIYLCLFVVLANYLQRLIVLLSQKGLGRSSN